MISSDIHIFQAPSPGQEKADVPSMEASMSWAVSARWPLVRFHPKTSRFWDDFCFPNVCNTCPCLKNSPFSTGPTFHGFSCRFSHFQTSQPPTFEPQKKALGRSPICPCQALLSMLDGKGGPELLPDSEE